MADSKLIRKIGYHPILKLSVMRLAKYKLSTADISEGIEMSLHLVQLQSHMTAMVVCCSFRNGWCNVPAHFH